MSFVNSSAARHLFNLNVSSRELNKIEKSLAEIIVGVSNHTYMRLEKTLLETGNAEKRERIQKIMEKLSDIKYGNIFATRQEQIRAEPSELSNHPLTRSRLETIEKNKHVNHTSPVVSGSAIVTPSEAPLTRKQTEMLASFCLLGVNLTSWPNNYRELFFAIRKDLPENISRILATDFSHVKEGKKLAPGVTQDILLALLNFPECRENVALHFEGRMDVNWSQGEQILSNVQVGKNGLCGGLSFKWCGDENQNIHFFKDMNTTAGLEEVMSIKIFENNIQSYLDARELTVSGISDKLEFQSESFYIFSIKPLSEGDGHTMAVMAHDSKQAYKFFDPNFGQFSFSSSEKMKGFIQKFTSMCYPTLTMMKNITLNHV